MSSVPSLFRCRCVWALIAAGALELLLAATSIWIHHQTAVNRGDQTAQTGEGLVIYSDGLGYYAWLRSLLIDGDWSFDNEFDEHNVGGNALPSAERRTPLGRRCNQWSVGPACVWSLTVVPGHAAVAGLPSPWPADGYSLPYQIFVAAATMLASFLGLAFLYRACSLYARPKRAALAAIWLTLGTTVVYYNAIESSMAHGPATAVVAGLVAYWLCTFGRSDLGRWFLVGLLVGASTLMRWQLATFAILPLGEVCLQRWSLDKGELWQRLFRLLAAAAAMLGFLPQMIAWKCVYGEWFVTPLPIAAHWLSPDWHSVLVSTDRSLFYWTPLAAFAVIGAFWPRPSSTASASGSRDSRPLAILLIAFLAQVYVLASLWGKPGVYHGASFGMRHLTEALIALGPGLAATLNRASTRQLRWLAVIGWSFVLWNLLLICQYRYGFLPTEAGAPVETLARNARWLIDHRPWFVASQVILGPFLIAWHLRGGKEDDVKTTSRPHDSQRENCRPSSLSAAAAA